MACRTPTAGQGEEGCSKGDNEGLAGRQEERLERQKPDKDIEDSQSMALRQMPHQ